MLGHGTDQKRFKVISFTTLSTKFGFATTAAVEGTWHTQLSAGQILALAFR